VKIEQTEKGAIIKIPSQFSQGLCNSFLQLAGTELEKGTKNIIIDFSETTFIDSSAIGSLVSVAKDAKQKKCELFIQNLSSEIRELFIETGLDKIFNIVQNEKIQNAEIDIFTEAIDIKLEIKNEIVKDICIMHLSGIMSHPQGTRFFKQQFLLAMAKYKKILIDLEDLTFFDSLSVSVVLNMNTLLKETGGSLRLCNANYIVNDLFSTLNLHQIIPIYNTSTEALQDWI
jgi:anti-anti-sigma factor